ncbi:MbtH protein [Haloactinospora alba]|uniref:MbtH protein n=1 Tax=Haloactinospora alba TaxID=405555 RepID=A0A543N954_9ACTN|nr:MbtH family NRPS accessory protein [Haloactinospora alba]TQN28362.1 MbtH protein [Haloactinospora alba]
MDSDGRTYHVVVNHEEQYSIWQEGWDIPAGWRAEGFSGTKEECLHHISGIWTDLRPLSLRQRLAQGAEGSVEE